MLSFENFLNFAFAVGLYNLIFLLRNAQNEA